MANNGNAQLMCGNCGGKLEIDPEKPTVVCSYCGSCFSVSDLLNESERLKIERIRRDVELGRQNLELERLRQAEAIRNDNIRQTESAKLGTIGKIAIVLAVIAMLMSVSAFTQGEPLIGSIAAVQFILFTVTFLIAKQVIPVKLKKLHTFLFAAALILEIPFSLLVSSSEVFNPPNSNGMIAWDEIVLSDRIPELESKNGYVTKNTKKELMMNVYNVPLKRYYSIVEDCKAMGFTVDGKEDDKSYQASAQDGYKIRIHYSVLHDGTVDIDLFAPTNKNSSS